MPKAECIIKKYILSATKNVFSVDTEGRGTNLYNNRSIQYPNTIIVIIMGIFDRKMTEIWHTFFTVDYQFNNAQLSK